MKWIFSHKFAVLFALLLIAGAVYLLLRVTNPPTPDWTTTTVERGDVSTVVSVSGFIEAPNTAELAFPTTGIITEVFVDEGNSVVAGEVMATLASNQLVAERNEAVAALRAAQAELDEANAGPREETIVVAETNVLNAEQNLTRAQNEQAEIVTNARATLLSSNLEALAVDDSETANAPTVSGTYTCDTEGTYTLSVYRSASLSGFSYKLSGLESGTYVASTDQPRSIGECGLFVQFNGSGYADSEWTITVPNTRSSSYLGNKNTYDQALINQANAIEAAADNLRLAREEANLSTAGTRVETVRSSSARVDEARARIARIDADIADRSIVAPFSGTVTSVDIVPGETTPNTPVIVLLAADAFELTARVPEIDIRKIEVGQSVNAIFDAAAEETLTGTIGYISPLATEIDGVAYFEATIELDAQPAWIRSGLNADIDIVIETNESVLKLPKRFIGTSQSGETIVLVPDGRRASEEVVSVITEGNDGYVMVENLREGSVVILP